jgi:hypothetical protein
MRCPKCKSEMGMPNFTLNSKDNTGNSLPKNWFKGHKLWVCKICQKECCPCIYYVHLEDGSVYGYNSNIDSLWTKMKISVRNVPKERIIGGYFVQ